LPDFLRGTVLVYTSSMPQRRAVMRGPAKDRVVIISNKKIRKKGTAA
jgi:hypothetical protein